MPSLSGGMHITVRSPRPADATVTTWSLPAYGVVIKSPSIMMATGDDLVIIRSRIAKALNIRNGDAVDFTFNDTGDTFNLQVTVRDNIDSDILIHDFLDLGIAKSITMDSSGETLVLEGSETQLLMSRQYLWAGMRMEPTKNGSAFLRFDGASRNNPKGPAGFGFHIVRDENGDKLVEGACYAGMNRSSNEMEYEGLIEGLIWATRLYLVNLMVCGDSELIINQVIGKYSIKNHRLKALHAKVTDLLQRYNEKLNISFAHIPRELNEVADNLANRAIATKSSVVTLNWPNVNALMGEKNGR
jgi:ribonuclease HI